MWNSFDEGESGFLNDVEVEPVKDAREKELSVDSGVDSNNGSDIENDTNEDDNDNGNDEGVYNDGCGGKRRWCK